jgi:hypothetical protein
MLPAEMVYLTVTLSLALAALIHWKRRRDAAAKRMNRGLAGYVATRRRLPLRAPLTDETDTEDLIPA